MKSIFSAVVLAFSTAVSAQLSFSAKANYLFKIDSPTWKNISATALNAYHEKGKNKAGFNVGVSLRAPLHGSFFLMPELYYTSYSTEFTEPVSAIMLEAKSNRLDMPVLVGYTLLGENLGFIAGPVASYNFVDDQKYDRFKEDIKNNFTVGYQFGLQATFSKILATARYEGAFSKDQRDYISSALPNAGIRFDSRPSFFIAGLGYKF